MDDLHEGIDVRGGFGAVIHVICVLVHIECQDRPAAGEVGCVVGRPRVDEPLVARRVGEKNPSRTAAFRLADAGEFSPPPIKAAEVSSDRLGKRA
jgi:hypothetical protein